MAERRVETRMMCAELVDVRWKDKSGRTRKATAILEDISLTGACLQFDAPLTLKTSLSISYPKGELQGVVRYCVFREIGYFVGVEFAPQCRWSRSQFHPQHLLDLRRLMERSFKKAARRIQPPVM
jgi:hypothetical protein